MKFRDVFTNVWYVVGAALVVFLTTLAAAVIVGYVDGGFGCGGGTVGAMIGVAGVFLGLLVGISLKFAPSDGQ